MVKRSTQRKTDPLTYREWRALGYQVQKGQKSKARNKDGEAVFTSEQVKQSQANYGNEDYDQDDYDQWYASYGYTRDWA